LVAAFNPTGDKMLLGLLNNRAAGVPITENTI